MSPWLTPLPKVGGFLCCCYTCSIICCHRNSTFYLSLLGRRYILHVPSTIVPNPPAKIQDTGSAEAIGKGIKGRRVHLPSIFLSLRGLSLIIDLRIPAPLRSILSLPSTSALLESLRTAANWIIISGYRHTINKYTQIDTFDKMTATRPRIPLIPLTCPPPTRPPHPPPNTKKPPPHTRARAPARRNADPQPPLPPGKDKVVGKHRARIKAPS